MRKLLVVLVLIATASFAFGSAVQESAPEPTPEPMPTIVEIAVEDGRFTTLVTALEAAGLVDTLSGDGPFTVFAPTDDAFAALPAGTVEALLADTEALTQVLTYHVVPGKVMAADVVGLSNATTLQGQPVAIGTTGGVFVNAAEVIITDIEGSNGVIHVIDSVILPPSANIVETAIAAGSFETLVTAVQAAGLVETLSGEGPFTVFAPTDEAFAKLPEGTIESLLADIPTLTDVLTYHVLPGRVFAGDVVQISESGPTVQGQTIDIAVEDGGVVLNGASNVVVTNIITTNGIIHVIDTVILPE
ncbi:MAG: fasciclin domain-containing protein [Spirochaetales bacterium]